MALILGAVGVPMGGPTVMVASQGGFLQSLLTWVFGGIHPIVLGGGFSRLWHYHSARRTADAAERLSPCP